MLNAVATAAPTSGETVRSVASTEGAPFALTGVDGRPRFDTSLPAGPARPAITRDLALVASKDRVRAIALMSGRTAWLSDARLYLSPDAIVTTGGLLFVESASFDAMVALRRSDGRRAFTLPGVVGANVLDGVLYAKQRNRYVAFDARNGRALWATLGGGQGLSGTPLLIGPTLLQPFTDSGAIIVGNLYAFDVRTGHVRWVQSSQGPPLGVVGAAVYVNATWFPAQLDNYVPLTVARIDTSRGAVLDAQTYRPEPGRNAHPAGENPGVASAARVAAGFVYLQVRGTWYRYDADHVLADAHPSRLDDIAEILDWFDDGALLVVARGELAIARRAPSGLELHRIGAATSHSVAVRRIDGTRYVVAADELYAIDPSAERARRVGAIPCAGVDALEAWDAHVTVLCTATGTTARALGFDDVAAARVTASSPAPRPVQAPPPRFIAHAHVVAVPPPASESFNRQWWIGPAAPLPGGGLVFVASRGSRTLPEALGRVTTQGTVSMTQLPGEPSVSPDDLVVDRSGAVWINDTRSATVSQVAADGSLATHMVGDPTPRTGRNRFGTAGIRVAIGPDGAVWYARSHPTREIGRLEGGIHFAIPDDIGDVVRLRGDKTGFWFVATSGIGWVDTNGRFTQLVAASRIGPAILTSRRAVIAPAGDGTAWIAIGTRIVHASARGVLRDLSLPNVTLNVRAAAVGCDGALYAAEPVTQIVRIAPDGRIDEIPLDLSADGIVTGADCRIWFTAGSNAPAQEVGTLTFTPSPSRGNASRLR